MDYEVQQISNELNAEALDYPDKRTDLEGRIWTLEPLYEQAGIMDISNPNAIVLGAGRGADLIALDNLRDDMQFVAAVDSYPPEPPHNIVKKDGRVLATTTQQEIVSYLNDSKSQEDLQRANLIVGTRLGSNTIAHAITHLPKDGEYLGIFTTDDRIRDVIKDAIINRGDLHADTYKGNDNETVFRVTPNRSDNPIIDIMNKTGEDTRYKVA